MSGTDKHAMITESEEQTMLSYENAYTLYWEISEKAAECTIKGFDKLYRRFLQNAVDYAKTRADWTFLDQETRLEQDTARSIKHDAFMSLLTAVCRNLEITGVEELMPDRKTKGDFACYLSLFLALDQR